MKNECIQIKEDIYKNHFYHPPISTGDFENIDFASKTDIYICIYISIFSSYHSHHSPQEASEIYTTDGEANFLIYKMLKRYILELYIKNMECIYKDNIYKMGDLYI